MSYPMETAQRQDGTLTMVERREHSIRESIQSLTQRLQHVADRIYGAEPTPAMKGAGTTAGLTSVEPLSRTIESAQERTMSELNDLAHQIGRLENL